SELVGSDLELPHTILRKIHQRSAHYLIIVVAAVYGDVAATTESACGRYFQSVRFCGVEVGRWAVARNQKGEFQKVASIQRDTSDGGGCHQTLHFSLRQLHLRFLDLHQDGLARLGDSQFYVHGRGTSHI